MKNYENLTNEIKTIVSPKMYEKSGDMIERYKSTITAVLTTHSDFIKINKSLKVQ